MTLNEVLHLERPLIGVDLETTGVVAKNSAICELALEIMKPGEPVREYRTLLRPMLPIPAEASAIHGITYRMTQACRICGRDEDIHPDAACPQFTAWPTFRQIAPSLIEGLTGADLAGYNVFFDILQLIEEFKRTETVWDPETARVLDGFRIWQVVEGRTLTHAVERWLKPLTITSAVDADVFADLADGNAHDAMWDIKMSTRVIASQIVSCRLPRDLDALHAMQWPDRYDLFGKLKWHERGDLRLTFGEHKDKPLFQVPKGYLKWIIGADFSERVKDICKQALTGRFPSRAATSSVPSSGA